MYMAIAASIQSLIVEGSLNPGDLLPSENALMTQFSASRDTVRKSLKELEVEGYIRTQPGPITTGFILIFWRTEILLPALS